MTLIHMEEFFQWDAMFFTCYANANCYTIDF